MTEQETPAMEILSKRSFTTVTATANQLIKRCKSTADEQKLEVILEGLEASTKEYLSIMLERLEVADLIDKVPEADALYRLDVKTLFELEKSDVDMATVSIVSCK